MHINYKQNMLQARTSPNYSILYYKKTHIAAVRRKFDDKKQIFGWGGSKCQLDEAQLRQYGDLALEKLDQGDSEKDVEEFIKRSVEPFLE